LRVIVEQRRFAFGLGDQYDAAVKRNEQRLAKEKVETVRALMRPEERLGSYRNMLPICAKAWGLECDRSYQGVIAVLPEGTYEGYPTTASRTPLFEWKPSPSRA
jgi:hypothetical protein